MPELREHPPSGDAHGVVSVLIVDDDPLVRTELVDALTANLEVTVAGEADDGDRVAAAVEAEAPDVVLMDVEMPQLDGVRAAWRLSVARPELPVVLMSADPSDELVLLALRAGAAGVVPKALGADALARVLRGVAEDEGAISRRTSRALGRELYRRRESARASRPIDSPLTTREWQVLRLMQSGATTTEVSRELFLSVHTVRSHVKRVLSKLGVHSRAEAIAWAEHRPDLDAGTGSVDAEREERALAHALAALLQQSNVGRPAKSA